METGFRGEAQDTQAVVAAAFGDGLQFRFAVLCALAENDFFAYGDFSAGADESFPSVWGELAYEQDFDLRLQVFVARGVVNAGRLGVNSDATAEQSRGEDAGVVEND